MYFLVVELVRTIVTFLKSYVVKSTVFERRDSTVHLNGSGLEIITLSWVHRNEIGAAKIRHVTAG